MNESLTMKRAVAVLEALLLAPAALFFAALVIRELANLDAASAARQIVTWYSGRMWTLWGLLIGLPLAVLAIGAFTLAQSRTAETRFKASVARSVPRMQADVATVCVAMTTMAAAGILAIVILHVLAN
jgi:hypothetical protein